MEQSNEHSNEHYNDHKCLCEKKLCNCKGNYNCICVDCDEWIECLKTKDNLYNESTCCTIICLPIKFPLNLIFCGPFTLYNILRNKCNDTTKKNYLC
jgi:hypothetical protein